VNPSFAQGVAAMDSGDFATAEQIFHAIVERDKSAHQAWLALAVTALHAGHPQLAVEHAQRAVALDRKNPDYLNKLGIAHGELGDFSAAEQAFRRALKLRPAHAQAHHNLGKALQKQDRLAEALKEFERAHALAPKSPAHLLSLSTVHRQLGQPALGLKALRRADPSYEVDLSPRIANFIADVDGVDAAVAWLRELLAQHPAAELARYALGIHLLSLGRWREGWELHAARARPTPELPPLLPPRLDGRRILLRAEYGLGDVLFFLRFAAQLEARGATIALECPAKLEPLLAGRMAFGHAGGADLELWIADLATALGTDATPRAFALQPDGARVASMRERLAQLGPPPYLGVTWRAGTDVLRGPELGMNLQVLSKEIPPLLLGKALRGWPGTLLSLQRAPVPGEREALGARIHDLSAANDDLRDALAVLAVLDEYVAVSNTNIHLRAGVGRTARVLVPNPPEWRWMRTGQSSPWFPGFSLYREPPNRDWSDALSRLREDLFAGSPPRARA
jgi:tetratricopeptide (TPR) repeat protein